MPAQWRGGPSGGFLGGSKQPERLERPATQVGLPHLVVPADAIVAALAGVQPDAVQFASR